MREFPNSTTEGDATYLDPNVIWDFLVVQELAAEVEVGLRRSGVGDLDLLEADLNEMSEEAHLLLVGHGVGEGLVSVSQVGAEPDGRLEILFVGPCPLREWHGLECHVAF